MEKYTAADLIERAVNEARKLPDYDSSDEESTARHAIPSNIHFDVHISQPDIEADPAIEVHGVKVTGLPRWLVTLLIVAGTGVAAAVTAFVAKLLAGH